MDKPHKAKANLKYEQIFNKTLKLNTHLTKLLWLLGTSFPRHHMMVSKHILKLESPHLSIYQFSTKNTTNTENTCHCYLFTRPALQPLLWLSPVAFDMYPPSRNPPCATFGKLTV